MTFDIPESTIRQIFSKYWAGRWVHLPIRLPNLNSFTGECGGMPSVSAATYHELRFPALGRRQAQSCAEGHTRSTVR